MQQTNTQQGHTGGDGSLAGRWLWIMDIIFAGIASYGFEALDAGLTHAFSVSWQESAKQMLVAFSLYAFFLYDIGIYHLLVKKSPFQLSLASVGRFFLDVIMSFLLLMMLLPGLRPNPEERTIQIIVAVSLWHLCAAIWHVIASVEYQNRLPTLQSFVPHFYFPGFYWFMMLAIYVIFDRDTAPDIRLINSTSYLLTLALCLLYVALLRTVQVVRLNRQGSLTVNAPTSQPAETATP